MQGSMQSMSAHALHGATQVAQCLAWPKQCLHASGNVVESSNLASEIAVSCSSVQLLYAKCFNIMMCYDIQEAMALSKPS